MQMIHWRMDEANLKRVLNLAKILHEPANECHLRWQRIVLGLCELTGASGGVSVVFTLNGDRPRIEVLAQIGKGASANQLVEAWLDEPDHDDAWEKLLQMLRKGGDALTRTRRQLLKHNNGSSAIKLDCIYSVLRLGDTAAGMLCFFRPRGRSEFNMTDARLVHLLHSEMNDLYKASHDPQANGMTPRQRQIHEFLLQGQGEKQIAVGLGLSRHTIHAHVKAIYKHFHVCSRPELLAQYVKG
ncbi:MAG TPA: helix-turn-helix transcriptional regulator [Tepidisphaeraceae bacterium]|jgi:DNA-binding CsgD family transcriptional regulator